MLQKRWIQALLGLPATMTKMFSITLVVTGLIAFLLGSLTIGFINPVPALWIHIAFAITLIVWFIQSILFTKTHYTYKSSFFYSCMRAVCYSTFFLSVFLFAINHTNSAWQKVQIEQDFAPQSIQTSVRVVSLSHGLANSIRYIVEPVSANNTLPAQWLLKQSLVKQSLPKQTSTKHNINKKQQDVTLQQSKKKDNLISTLQPGDIWYVEGNLVPIHGTQQAGVFDQKRWLTTMGVGAILYADSITLEAQPSYPVISKQGLQLLRLRLRNHITEVAKRLDATHYDQDLAVLIALLTGDRALVNSSTKSLYQYMGISHLLAISGPHVLFAALMFSWLCIKFLNLLPRLYKYVPRKKLVMPCALMVVIGYALLAGWDIPAQRTCFMFVCTYVCLLFTKRFSVWLAMLASACLMLYLDPMASLSVAFWLSFMAVGLLVLFTQSQFVAQALVHSHSWQQKVMLGIATFVIVQILFFVTMLPVTLHFFGQASLMAVFVNLFAIPILSLVVVPINIIAFGISYISASFADVLWTTALVVLHKFHALILAAYDAVPNALFYIHFDNVALWATAVMMCLWLIPVKKSVRWLSVPIVLLFFMPRQLPTTADVHVLDGTSFSAVLIRANTGNAFKPHNNMLYISDIQPTYDYLFELEHVVQPALQKLNSSNLDVVVISSPTKVNTQLVSFFKKSPQVTKIYINSSFITSKKTSSCNSKESWQWGDTFFSMLAPWKSVPTTGDDASCVMRIATNNPNSKPKSILLMGNSSSLVQQMLMRTCTNVNADIVQLPKQGSFSGFDSEFLQKTNARYVFVGKKWRISNYRGLQYPHHAIRAQLEQQNTIISTTAGDGGLYFGLY